MKQPLISQELLHKLLFVRSEQELTELLEEHPELQGYAGVALPMHKALSMLLIAESSAESSKRKVIAVSEFQPRISAVISLDSEGNRVAELIEIPPHVLAQILLVAPAEIQPYIPLTMQVSLHHPDYLTEESCMLMAVMTNSPQIDIELKRKISVFQAALEICVKNGMNRERIMQIREESNWKSE
jgi:hypothetical protein